MAILFVGKKPKRQTSQAESHYRYLYQVRCAEMNGFFADYQAIQYK
jgi:hypothetical protein